MNKNIGHRIRRQRQQLQPPLSMNKLAVLAEIDPGQLSRAERGLSGLSITALERICHVLHIHLRDLFDEEKGGHDMIAEPAVPYHSDERNRLVACLLEVVCHELEQELIVCSPSEQLLIKHQIRSAIEEGIQRGKVQAEREIEAIKGLLR